MNKSTENTMFYGASPVIFERSKALRVNMTEAEEIIWKLLSKNKMMGLRFRTQHPIDMFIADFYCHPIKLVIEIDGGIHNTTENKEHDLGRTAELEKYGIEVIRFTNEQVFQHFDFVRKSIVGTCMRRKAEFQVPFRGFRGKMKLAGSNKESSKKSET